MSHPMETGPSPELDELQQRETAADERLLVKVDEVADPVRTYALPSRLAVMQSMAVGQEVVRLYGADLRRARAVVWPEKQETPVQFYIGVRADEVQQGTSALMTTDFLTLELKNTEPLYARAVTDDVVISYLLEQWSD